MKKWLSMIMEQETAGPPFTHGHPKTVVEKEGDRMIKVRFITLRELKDRNERISVSTDGEGYKCKVLI